MLCLSLQKFLTRESASRTESLWLRDCETASLERSFLRREISWWKLKSGAGGAYSTGAVETRVILWCCDDDGEEEEAEYEEEKEMRGFLLK